MKNNYNLNRSNIYTEKNHIVVDCDEVLVRISPKWVHLMHTQEWYEYFNQFFMLDPEFNLGRDFEAVLMRPTFYLNQWLERPDILGRFTESEIEIANRKFMDLYDNDYYGDLPPTNFARSLASVINTSVVDKITVVSRTVEGRPNLDTSKIQFIKKLFTGNNKKVDILLLEGNESKSDLISDLGNKVGYIYEDEVSNIEDIILNSLNIKDTSIMIPKYGYNTDVSESILDIANDRNIKLEYYRDR